jgi:DNA-directed RNA polymerase specialized sigma24 family protein
MALRADVFDRHRESVWVVCISVTRQSNDAEEAVQDTFLGAVERMALGQRIKT